MRFREIREDSKKQSKMTDAQFQDWAAAAAEKYDVPLPLMMHVMRNETGHLASDPTRRANAVSPADAQGIMQIQPATGKQHGLKNPFDPKQNIEAGARILGALLYKYDNNHNSVLAAYNSGQGTVDDYLNGTNKTGKNPKLRTTPNGEPPFPETERYIHGQVDKKGNVIKPAYDPNAQYDINALKAAVPATPAASVTAKTTDPVAVGQAKIDKMPAYDRSKGEPVSPPSQAQARASDNKIDAMAQAAHTGSGGGRGPTAKDVNVDWDNKMKAAQAQGWNDPKNLPPSNWAPIGKSNLDKDPSSGSLPWKDPNPPKEPAKVSVFPNIDSHSIFPSSNAAPASAAISGPNQSDAETKRITSIPAPVAKVEPLPKPVVAPVVKSEPAPISPVVKSEPLPKPVVTAPVVPAVDPTGGSGRTGPTVAASKGTDINNPLNKGPVSVITPQPAPAPTGDWKALASANKITNPNIINPGQELKLPGDLKYTVSKGDTLSGIASGNYKGTAPITPAAVPPPPPEITTDRLKALSGNASGLPSTAGPLPTIDLLNKTVKDKTSSADLVPDIKTAQADTDADDLKKLAMAENSKTINTRRYSFLLGL